MTMFSMKPKFDLAEFLAQPAGAGTRAKARPFRRPPAPKTDSEQEAPEKDEFLSDQ
jgi:hypothetical protein